MKFVFTICLLVFTLQVYPHTVLIGSGSGSVVRQDMNGLNPGDTLAIRAGRYEKGGLFFNLRGITIVNHDGIVEFGSTVSIGNLKKVSISGSGVTGIFYGFLFRNFHGDAFMLQASCSFLSLAYCEYRNLDGTAFNASQFFTTYSGDTATFALYKTTFSYQKLVNSGLFFMGSWASPKSFQNVSDSTAFLHFIIDSTASEGCQVIGQSIYRMLASDWRITGSFSNAKHDVGIFQTAGNGTVCNLYRKGGWGYIWRIWNLGLNGRAESYLYNCIDLSTMNYGTIDTRMEVGDTTNGKTVPFLRGGSMHVLNNTVGNKQTLGYVSQLVIAGSFCSACGYHLEVRNNLCFNTVATGFDQIVKQNTSDPLLDTSNNLYSVDPIAQGILLDTIQCNLNPAGPAIDNGLNFSFINTDIDGVHRPIGKSADIGAREYAGAQTLPDKHEGAFSKNWLLGGLGFLLMAALVLIYRIRDGRKDKNMRFYMNG